MTENHPILLGLPEHELELLAAVAIAPWYSISFENATGKYSDGRLRTTKIVLQSDRVVWLESLAIEIGCALEAFRLSIRSVEAQRSTPKDAATVVIPGGIAEIDRLALLGSSRKISLVWKRLEYPGSTDKGPPCRFIDVPDGLLLAGAKGALLVSQDELPTWLRVEWAEMSIRRAIAEASRIQGIS